MCFQDTKVSMAGGARRLVVLLLAAAVSLCAAASASSAAAPTDELTAAIRLFERYPVVRTDITYYTANNHESKLDIYMPTGNEKPKPTLVYFHGGGWLGDYNKNSSPFAFLPILQLGWNVVNVDYRPASVSPAPAAVRDCLCALRWIGRNAGEYHIDVTQIVLMGHSAGGLLALTTGMIPMSSSGLGGPCVYADAYGAPPQSAIKPEPGVKAAAIVSWSGPTDLSDVASGPHQQPYATIWLDDQPDRATIARLVSPLTYVRPGLPPIVTVHGDRDPLVPYGQDVRLHDALTTAGVTNRLITIPGGGHGLSGIEATRDAWIQIFEFLEKAGLTLRP
jgi:acetyl esterase/lipase